MEPQGLWDLNVHMFPLGEATELCLRSVTNLYVLSTGAWHVCLITQTDNAGGHQSLS